MFETLEQQTIQSNHVVWVAQKSTQPANEMSRRFSVEYVLDKAAN
jgi:hypothetical protein